MSIKKQAAAVYARKSKFTGRGESIENQIAKCREYLEFHEKAGEEMEIWEYRDEGVSGKDMERPMMKRLLEDIGKGRLTLLICYRLDRVSRSVKDFSDLIVRLAECRVEFISVSESFDTRTPMGRAMMYISSVFAQLERETIAERIADNMTELAKAGRWLGGRTPLGYVSEKREDIDENQKKRSRYCLSEVPEEAVLVKLLFGKYLELGSLTKLETYLLNHDVKSRTGNAYGRYVLRAILTNPVYCVADREAYAYLREHSYGIYAEPDFFDGEHGLIAYNKNNCRAKAQRLNDVQDWILSVGEHKGIIPSRQWIAVQERIRENAALSYRYPKRIKALLSGILFCGSCGSFMRPKGGRKTKDGEERFYYQCECKERSRGELCRMPNLLGNAVDSQVLEQIVSLKEKIVPETSYLKEALEHMEREDDRESERYLIKKQIKEKERQQEALLDALGRSRNEAASSLILKRLEEVVKLREELKRKLESGQETEESGTAQFPYELLSEQMLHLEKEAWELLPVNCQKDLLKGVVKKVVWDGEYAAIHLWAEDSPPYAANMDAALMNC